MAASNRTGTEAPAAPGTAGDGQDNYPTYHDRPSSSPATGTKPTDGNLQPKRRTSPAPMLIGVIAFAVVVAIYIVWSVVQMAGTPAPTPPANTSGSGDAGLNRDVQPQSTSPAPAATSATPSGSDVPGSGSTSVTAQPAAPAQ